MNCGPENSGAGASSSLTAGVVGGVVGIVTVVVVLIVLAASAAIIWKVRRKHLHSSLLHLKPKEGVRVYMSAQLYTRL